MSTNMIALQLERIEDRLARVESRLVQLMLHMGLDPYTKTYTEPKDG